MFSNLDCHLIRELPLEKKQHYNGQGRVQGPSRDLPGMALI
jgi:hypothetical protein